jgi:hypothetical protein
MRGLILGAIPLWFQNGGITVPTVTIKNIPFPVHRRLKKRALGRHRSLNSEIIVCLEDHPRESGPSYAPARFLAEVRRLRQKMTLRVSDKAIADAVHEGRP